MHDKPRVGTLDTVGRPGAGELRARPDTPRGALDAKRGRPAGAVVLARAVARAADHRGDRRRGHPRPGRDHDDGDPAPQPRRARQEAELLVPVPDGAVVRGFSFQGAGAEPSARLLPRDEGARPTNASSRRPATPPCSNSRAFNLVRSSVFPVEPGGTQAVRLTYEHLLAGERRPGGLRPAAERVGRIQRPVEDRGQDHVDRADRRRLFPEPPAADLAPEGRPWRPSSSPSDAATEPGPFRLSFLRERADVSASLFAYPDPKLGGGYFLLLAGLAAARVAGPIRRASGARSRWSSTAPAACAARRSRRSARPRSRSSPASTRARRST